MNWADPSKSESSTQPNSSGGSWLTSDLVDFPPLGSEDLIRLGEDLLHVYPIFYKDRYYLPKRDSKTVSSISAVILRGKTSPTGLSPEEATALAETFRNVPLPRRIPSWCLTPLVVRPYLTNIPRVAIQTRGPDLWPMPCSVNRESFLAWNCAINPRTTTLLDSQTSGRENIVGSQCALRWFGYRTCPT